VIGLRSRLLLRRFTRNHPPLEARDGPKFTPGVLPGLFTRRTRATRAPS
jgi:hypothetical protein